MGSIPLLASTIRPVEQPDVLQNYGRLQQLRGMQQQQQQAAQMAPLQLQAAQQQVQGGAIDLQQKQQAQKDEQTFRAATQDPAFQGKTIGAVADVLASKGAISPGYYQSLKKADLEQRKELQGMDTTKLDNAVKATAANKQLFESVMSMPDDQLTQNWAGIVQQYNAIPGNDKRPLNPQQPLTKAQIAQEAPMLTIHQAYVDDELARRKNQTAATSAEVDLQKKQQDLSYGPTGAAADGKYSFLQKKLALGQQISDEDKAWMKGYEKQKLLVPVTSGNLRIEGYAQSRMMPVYDNRQKAATYVSAEELNRAKAEEPGRYTVAAYTPEALGAKDATNYFIQGKGGQQLTAFNTALVHLNTLDRLAGDLNNTDIRIANKAKQAWAEQTGSPAPANFAAAVNAMSGEVASALKASGATDQEIEKAASTFDKAQSPAQLKGAINTYRELLHGKAAQLKKQYEAGMQGRPTFDGSSQGGNQQQQSSQPMTITLPSGKKITVE